MNRRAGVVVMAVRNKYGVPISLAVLVALAAHGCGGTAGDRAKNDGRCPEGERCSDKAPHGLYFSGADLSDDIFGGELHPTAVSGSQAVRAFAGDVHEDSPFDAVSADPKIFTLDAPRPPTVVVRGVTAGNVLLRLFEPGTELLLDRVPLGVGVVSSIRIAPRELLLIQQSTAPWAVLADVPTPLVITLIDDYGTRLVDEGLTIITPSSPVAYERAAWDMIKVASSGDGPMMYRVAAGGHETLLFWNLVRALDDIARAPIPMDVGEGPLRVKSGEEATYCFLARSGGANVAGASWSFATSERVTISPRSEPLLPSCVSVNGAQPGAATLTVTASGLTKTFDLVVEPAG
jgi:hypothetical protein